MEKVNMSEVISKANEYLKEVHGTTERGHIVLAMLIPASKWNEYVGVTEEDVKSYINHRVYPKDTTHILVTVDDWVGHDDNIPSYFGNVFHTKIVDNILQLANEIDGTEDYDDIDESYGGGPQYQDGSSIDEMIQWLRGIDSEADIVRY